MKWGKKRIEWTIGIIMIVMIVFIAYISFYRTEITVSCVYGSVLGVSRIHNEKKGDVIYRLTFFFNSVPHENDLDSIEKIIVKYRESIQIHTFFSRPFQFNGQWSDFLSINRNCRYVGKTGQEVLRKNFVIFEKNNRVEYVDTSVDPFTLDYILKKHLHGILLPKVYRRVNLDNHLRAKSIPERAELLNLTTMKLEHVSIKERYGQLNVYAAPCSPCALKEQLMVLRLHKLYHKTKTLHLFSFSAQQHELSKILHETNLSDGSFYLDYYDVLDIGFAVIDATAHPYVIPLKEEV